MQNPFVYGEIVPRRGVRRPRGRARPSRRRPRRRRRRSSSSRPRRYGKSSLVRQALADAVAARRADRRGHRQQLQLLRRVPRGLRPGARGGGNALERARDVADRGDHLDAARDCATSRRRPASAASRRLSRWSRPRATSTGWPTRSSRCPAGSPPSASGRSSSRSTSSRPSTASTAAASSTRCAPRRSSSGRSATCSPAPSRA